MSWREILKLGDATQGLGLPMLQIALGRRRSLVGLFHVVMLFLVNPVVMSAHAADGIQLLNDQKVVVMKGGALLAGSTKTDQKGKSLFSEIRNILGEPIDQFSLENFHL